MGQANRLRSNRPASRSNPPPETVRPQGPTPIGGQTSKPIDNLCRTGSFSPDIFSVSIRICAQDPDWAFDYAKFVGPDIYADENDRKNEINPIMARRIREAIGGRVAKTGSGARRTVELQNEIIGHYSVMDGFDPAVVGTDDDE